MDLINEVKVWVNEADPTRIDMNVEEILDQCVISAQTSKEYILNKIGEEVINIAYYQQITPKLLELIKQRVSNLLRKYFHYGYIMPQPLVRMQAKAEKKPEMKVIESSFVHQGIKFTMYTKETESGRPVCFACEQSPTPMYVFGQKLENGDINHYSVHKYCQVKIAEKIGVIRSEENAE